MRSVPILVAAVLLGLLGGYAYSAMQPNPSRLDVPIAVEQRVYYANCNEARAAGKAPLYVGEPGYRAKLDADSDGIACEPYRGM